MAECARMRKWVTCPLYVPARSGDARTPMDSTALPQLAESGRPHRLAWQPCCNPIGCQHCRPDHWPPLLQRAIEPLSVTSLTGRGEQKLP